MKQFQFNYTGKVSLGRDIRRIKQWCRSLMAHKVLFQIYSEQLDNESVQMICDAIAEEMPEALYMGCSTNGNILMGEYANSHISIICTVYEYPTTNIELYQYKLDKGSEDEATSQIIEVIKDKPWVKAVMMNVTIRDLSMVKFCEDLSHIKEGIEVFGGGAFSEDMQEYTAFVFSSVGEISTHSVVFALIGGEDYHVRTTYLVGWKPLGREFHITKAEGFKLYEIDGEPAYEKYHRYLDIENDEKFFINTLEFPFFYEHNGINLLRVPVSCDKDGVLTMTADIDENVKAHIAYGDPETILSSVREGAKELACFAPDKISVYSCAARRVFWGAEEISGESQPFQMIAPTSGFYTSGEFLRTGTEVNLHNATLVVAAEREGDIDEENLPEIDFQEQKLSENVSMINRLAHFIQAATKELEISAKTDALTGLFNRGEIQRCINIEWNNCARKDITEGAFCRICSLVMMDIDNFKQVNDKYGHKEGDRVLQGLSNMLTTVTAENFKDGLIGRWGGEEFMVLLPGAGIKKAERIAEAYRKAFNEIDFPEAGHQTISLGVTEMHGGESSDAACMRVDAALYEAKRNGKDQTVVKKVDRN
jgi:diguanylate cyclase (GGDEF) domain